MGEWEVRKALESKKEYESEKWPREEGFIILKSTSHHMNHLDQFGLIASTFIPFRLRNKKLGRS